MAASILDRINELTGKTLLVRVDFNCPLADAKVSDSTRIDRVLPGLKQLAAAGAGLVLLSHLGRPKGRIVPEFSLQPVCDYLRTALGSDVPLYNSFETAQRPVAGQIVMLENLRFWAEEEANDEGFAARIAALGDVYVNDAFSVSHRAHASTRAGPPVALLCWACHGRRTQGTRWRSQPARATSCRLCRRGEGVNKAGCADKSY